MAKRTIRSVGDRIIVRPASKPKSSGFGGISPEINTGPQSVITEPRPTETGRVISVGRGAIRGGPFETKGQKPTPEYKPGDRIAYLVGAGHVLNLLGSKYLSISPWDVLAVL